MAITTYDEYEREQKSLQRLLEQAGETFRIMQGYADKILQAETRLSAQTELHFYSLYHQAIHREIDAKQRQLSLMANWN